MAHAAKRFDYIVKLVIIGDEKVGKTSLLLRYAGNAFSANYIETIGKYVCCGLRFGGHRQLLILADIGFIAIQNGNRKQKMEQKTKRNRKHITGNADKTL